jgi:hypothetical protein
VHIGTLPQNLPCHTRRHMLIQRTRQPRHPALNRATPVIYALPFRADDLEKIKRKRNRTIWIKG